MAEDADKKKPPLKIPTHCVIPVDIFVEVSKVGVEEEKINEIATLLRSSAGLDEKTKNVRISRAVDLYESLKPKSGLEGMLAAQMVGTHSAVRECLRRAMGEGQTFEGREMNLKQAQQLMDLYLRQVAALDKHRGKGQQKVTVEHVHVEAGAQAIVGNVESGQRSAEEAPKTPQPERLDQQTPVPADFDRKNKAPARANTRRGKARKA